MHSHRTVAALRAAYASGDTQPTAVVTRCAERVAAANDTLAAVIALSPDLEQQAARSERRMRGSAAGPLEGVPVLVKDNIAVSGMATTAGSLALADHRPDDAQLVTRLRRAGAIVLGKTNLSEWANFRSTRSTSGWSAVGGQSRNPHDPDRSPSGSSSGSAAAVAAGFAPLAIGTETDGSILAPAGHCGVVGFKPTLGTVPGGGIVPISSAQDTAGAMAAAVADAALLWAVMAGVEVTVPRGDLSGVRLGLWRPDDAQDASLTVLDEVAATLAAVGAVVSPVRLDAVGIIEHEWPALLSEFRAEIDAFLAGALGARVRDLAELVEFNEQQPAELLHFGQEIFEQALAAPAVSDARYQEHRTQARALARKTLHDALATGIDAVVTLSNQPAELIDYARGDVDDVATSTPAAVAGWPSISVPGGTVDGLPVGVTLTAPAGSDGYLLRLAAGLEAALKA